jgi:hypothetical protein
MKKVFTLYGKEKVLGKTRNVYMKANTKSKYIKYKGEFMKLKEYVKTAKPVKLKEYVKTAKIAKPTKKTKKKSAKPTEGVLYFIYGKGGGLYDDVKFEHDIRVPKQVIEALLKTLDNKDNAKKYDEICNFEYSFIINGKQYYIRPFIKIKEGHNIIFKFFFAYDGWRHSDDNTDDNNLLWIEIPIHITQFFTDITDSRTGSRTGSITSINTGNITGSINTGNTGNITGSINTGNTGINTGSRNVSTHIHITAEPEKLLDYNIYALIITKQGLYIDLRHIYLMANTINDVIQLLRKYANKKLFSKWQKYHVGDAQHKPVKLLSYWMINNNRWRNVATPSIIQALNADNTLTEQISYDLLICINTLLSRIMIDIFKYIDPDATDAVAASAANISIPQKIPTAYKHELAIDIIRTYVNVDIIHERKSFTSRKYSNGKENMPPQQQTQKPQQPPQKPQPSHRQQVIQLSPLSPLSISPTPLSPLSISPTPSPPQLPLLPILPKPQQPQPISPPQKPPQKSPQKPPQKSPQKSPQKPPQKPPQKSPQKSPQKPRQKPSQKPQHTQPLRPSQKTLT